MEDTEGPTEEVDEQSHARLTAGISKLDRTQHIKAPARGEPSSLTGEFDLARSHQFDVNGVVALLESSARHVDIGKTIKKTQNVAKVLPKPLEKPQAERIKRSTGFESTAKKLGRWDATVARSRTVDHVSFPLKFAQNKLLPTKEYLSKLKLKSELEQKLDAIEDREGPQESEEEAERYPMTYEEMLEHRQELAKLRAQQSFKAAKAKRQSKIKSKKYHRILKKERMKQQLKEFEELQQTDPEEALRKLETLEKARAEERHTLRHKNTGKWAKSKLVRAKYNPEVRQQLAEQLAVSRNLTHKAQTVDSSDDESAKEEVIPDLPISQDQMNPWMLKNGEKSAEEANFDFGYKKYLKERIQNDGSSSENEDAEVNDAVEKAIKTINNIKHQNISLNMSKDESYTKYSVDVKADSNIVSEDDDKSSTKDSVVVKGDSNSESEDGEIKIQVPTDMKNNKSCKPVSTTDWAVETQVKKTLPNRKKDKKQNNLTKEFETLELDISKKVSDKINSLRKDIESINTNIGRGKKRKAKEGEDNLSKLKFKNQKVRPIIDTELHETTDKHPAPVKNAIKLVKDLGLVENVGDSILPDIDPSQFISAKPKHLATAIFADSEGYNNLDDEEQVVPKFNIEEVFEEDDVVASFRQEKEDEANKDKPADVDLSLPGWGCWGGKGVKAPKRKRNRFVFKAPPKLPRRDENKGDIIIKEFKDPKLAIHKVTELPFPFTSLKDFEASIRAPLGNTFIPETAHQKVIKPSVFTKAGTIIEPMDDDELLVPRNQSFKNKAIIKLLGHK